MPVLLKVSHWHALDEAFDEDGVSSFLLECIGEVDLIVAYEVFVEDSQVFLLDVEVDLVDQCLLEGVFSHWDFVCLGE